MNTPIQDAEAVTTEPKAGARNDGGQAFPFTGWRSPDGMVVDQRQMGMTLRDYFAAQAMQQQLAVFAAHKSNVNDYQIGELARLAYVAADALLRAREA